MEEQSKQGNKGRKRSKCRVGEKERKRGMERGMMKAPILRGSGPEERLERELPSFYEWSPLCILSIYRQNKREKI